MKTFYLILRLIGAFIVSLPFSLFTSVKVAWVLATDIESTVRINEAYKAAKETVVAEIAAERKGVIPAYADQWKTVIGILEKSK